MLLGRVIAVVAEFVSLVSLKDYGGAAALGQRIDLPTFKNQLSAWDWMLDDIGEIPSDGWRDIWVQGPIEGPEGTVAYVEVPVVDRNGEHLDWFLKFALVPGLGEDWRIDYVTPSN